MTTQAGCSSSTSSRRRTRPTPRTGQATATSPPTSTSLWWVRCPDGCRRERARRRLPSRSCSRPNLVPWTSTTSPPAGRLDKGAHTMRRTAIGGAILAVIAFLLILFGQALNLELERVAMTGAALGAAVALVPDRPPLFRALGFAAGFLVGWGGYALRAGVLP